MSGDNETNLSLDETQFPVGLRVLAIDDNVVCLEVLVTTLEQCQYKVTATTKACEALEMLREKPENFDIVITDVKMPDIDGFALLEIIGLEMDIPVIMTSGTDDRSTVLKGIIHGARDYLLKPVRVQEIKNIWQHVVRKNMEKKAMEIEKSNEKEGEEDHHHHHHPKQHHDHEDGSTRKKQRLNWTSLLHIKFLNAIHQLGTADKAVPKKIFEIMNEPGLSRENVASHLQKYRKMLRKNGAKVNQERDSNNNNLHRGRRPSEAAIFFQSHEGCSSRNPDSIWLPVNKAAENQDMLFQHSPQLVLSSKINFPSSPPDFPGQQFHGDHSMYQFPSSSTSSRPFPQPFSDPYFAFDDFSPSYQTQPDVSTAMGSTLNPSFLLVKHEGGSVNFDEGQTTGGCPIKVQSQIFMQHCPENFEMDSSSMQLNGFSFMDDDLSIIMKQFKYNGTPYF